MCCVCHFTQCSYNCTYVHTYLATFSIEHVWVDNEIFHKRNNYFLTYSDKRMTLPLPRPGAGGLTDFGVADALSFLVVGPLILLLLGLLTFADVLLSGDGDAADERQQVAGALLVALGAAAAVRHLVTHVLGPLTGVGGFSVGRGIEGDRSAAMGTDGGPVSGDGGPMGDRWGTDGEPVGIRHRTAFDPAHMSKYKCNFVTG